MYKSIKEYVNEANEPQNDVSNKVLKTIKKYGFTFDVLRNIKYPAAIAKDGVIKSIYVDCSKNTQWYTITVHFVDNAPTFSLTMKNSSMQIIKNRINVLTQLRSDLESASNLMSELATKFNAFGDFEKLPKVEL